MDAFDLPGLRCDDLGPRRVVLLRDPEVGLEAAVVVDTLRAGPSGGGVRIAADVGLGEIARLARAMTLKYALLSMPVGGAKAGIRLDPASPARDAVVRAFVAAIRPLVSAGIFVPGPDMGTSAADFASLVPAPEGRATDEDLTGWGVVAAARAAARAALGGRSLEGLRVAIEGFGKVGTATARFFVEEGAQVVAVSTVRATVYAEEGLDVDALIEARAAHGEEAIERVPGVRVLPREALFGSPADVLVPGARPDALHPGNVGDVRARLIVPGSNIPYAEGAVEALAARGIVAVPDFVANAGGVLAVVCALQGMDRDASRALVRGAIEASTTGVLERARREGETPEAAAAAIARERLAADR